MRSVIVAICALLLSCLLEASLAGKKICVDPGHGGSDPGALGVNGSAYPDEADINLDVDLRFRTLLVNDSASVLLTRESDTTVSLANRVDQANSWGATIFLSTHQNSHDLESANGTETYAYQSGTTSDSLAHKVQDELIAHMKRTNRGVKYAGYYVLKYTNMPAILSEGVFVSNNSDFSYITTAAGKEAHAVALYHAVCAHFGVTPQDDSGASAPGAVKGFVYNLSTGLGNVEGNRIAGATVTLTPTSGTPLTTTTSATGLFTFSSVEPGNCTLAVSKTGFVSAQKSITVTSGTDTWASTGIEESSGGATAVLKGFVYNLSSGLGNIEENRISGATCRLKSTTTGAETSVESGMNGLTGYFLFTDLTPGDYTLTIEKTGYQTAVRSLTLIAGDNWASTGIETQSGVRTGTLNGLVYALTMFLNPSGIAGAEVTLSPLGGGDTLSTTTGGDGTFSFNEVKADDYMLTVTASGYQTAEKSITIIAGQTLTVNIGLSPEGGDETIGPDDEHPEKDTGIPPPGENEDADEGSTLPDDGECADEDDILSEGGETYPAPNDTEENVSDGDGITEEGADETGCACALI